MKKFSQKYREHYKNTFLLAYPVCLSQLGHITVGIIDIAMVGYIGTSEQAAAGLAHSIFILGLVFGLGVSTGITPLIAISDGEKDRSSISDLLKHGIIVNFITSIFLFIVLFSISPVLRILDQPADVVDLALPFLKVILLSMIPLSIFSAFKQFAEGLSDTKTAMIITIGSNFLNIFLNYIFIFGKYGFDPMGLMGSCWASFWARVIMAFAMFLYLYYNKRFEFYWKHFYLKKISLSLIKKILGIGIPSGLQWVFETGAFGVAVIMTGWIGAKEQAAHQIALCIASITYMIASGLSAATSVRVGNNVGIKNTEGIRNAGFSSFCMTIGFMSIAAITFITGKNLFPLFFSKDIEVISIASSLLVIAGFFQLSDGIQVVGLGALRGLKDVKIPTLITLVAYWVIGLPLSYFFAFKLFWGVQGVWYGLLAGLSAAAISLFLRFNYISKKIIIS